MTERDDFAHYRDAMSALGFQPSTRRGQNFLLDPSLHRWLAEQAGAGANDTVVEIGVGLGFLTRELAAVAGRVVGIEIDDRLLTIARRDLQSRANVELVLGDALADQGLLPAIPAALTAAKERGGRALLVANLPYSISGPLIAELACLPQLPDRAILLVQKELAQRLAASPSTPDYGSLSVLAQNVFEATVLRDVPPQVFRPRPKVMSAVLQLERRAELPELLVEATARQQFARFVRALFQQRRKTLRNTLARTAQAMDVDPAAALASASVDLGQRAEALTPGAVLDLWAAMRSR